MIMIMIMIKSLNTDRAPNTSRGSDLIVIIEAGGFYSRIYGKMIIDRQKIQISVCNLRRGVGRDIVSLSKTKDQTCTEAKFEHVPPWYIALDTSHSHFCLCRKAISLKSQQNKTTNRSK